MCGICGVVDAAGGERPEALRPMLARLAHRGPDHEAVHVMSHCAFGHRRLAIIDLSEQGNQPMVSPDRGLMVVHNGEIYNHHALRRALEADGYRFRSRSDTEVLVHGYDRWGDDLVRHLEGMFAFAIWDASRQRLYAARDPLGKKPFSWCHAGGRLVFASEISALLAGLGRRPDLEPGAIEAYLRYRYVPGNVSVYRGVEKLRPGHRLVFEPLSGEPPVVARYWTPRYRPDRRLTPAAATELLAGALVEAVGRRLESDVPVAALLSGGLDSSLVVAIAAKDFGVRWKTVHAYATGDPDDERRYARLVAEHCATEHEEIEIAGGDLARLPAVLGHFSEPYADDSALPSAHVFSALRRHATVAITGDGGDEVFGGYLHTRGFYFRDRLGPMRSLGHGVGALVRAVPGYARHRALRRVARLGQYVALPGPAAFALTRSTAWNEDARRLLRDDVAVDPYLERAFAEADATSDLEKMLVADMTTTLADAYLLKVDRTSMAASVEARCPILDVRLVEAAHTIPPRVLMPGGTTKALERRIAERYLPRAVIDRPKRGFSLPLASYVRRVPRDRFGAIVDHPHAFARSHLDRRLLATTLDRFHAGESDLAYRLWSILCLEVWYRGQYVRDIDPSAVLDDLA